MPRQVECEHDADFYQIVAGSGLSVTEQCSECGAKITTLSPRQKIEAELKEEEKEERKQKKAAKKRKATLKSKKDEDEENVFEKAKYKVEDLFD